ncbi:MAG: hypothetical protein HQ515_07965 [Phycisphaeraceae bacterium]|nr:hypothetical protein [Phycisphaeraceae bacterium]
MEKTALGLLDLRGSPGPYEYETKLSPIDMLTGDDRARHAVDKGLDKTTLDDISRIDLDRWTEKASPYRLYPAPTFKG